MYPTDNDEFSFTEIPFYDIGPSEPELQDKPVGEQAPPYWATSSLLTVGEVQNTDQFSLIESFLALSDIPGGHSEQNELSTGNHGGHLQPMVSDNISHGGVPAQELRFYSAVQLTLGPESVLGSGQLNERGNDTERPVQMSSTTVSTDEQTPSMTVVISGNSTGGAHQLGSSSNNAEPLPNAIIPDDRAWRALPAYKHQKDRHHQLFNCFENCRRGRFGKRGFLRRWNLVVHLRNCHGQDVQEPKHRRGPRVRSRTMAK